MTPISKFAAVGLAALSLGACASSGPKEGAGTVIGAGAGAVAGGLVGGAVGGSSGAVTGAAVGGVIGNAVGRDLDEQDRAAMLDAETYAFENGQRRPWRGKRAYGYVEPGPVYTDLRGQCRDYTQRIYIDGRPRLAQGVACRGADGAWRPVS